MTDSGEQRRIPGGRVARVAPLVGLAGRTAGEAVAGSLRRNRQTRDARARQARAAARYAQRLGNSRGVLMKAGQILSMLLPESGADAEYRSVYQRAFARLFDDAPPMPAHIALATVEAELGRPVGELFASFDPRPLAAASIGQVHAATLHDGTRVAVKVQYPGVEAAIRADLANTELLATFLQLILTVVPALSRMDVRAIAAEVSERISEEIDYLREAANQREYAAAYRGHPFIHIPSVHDELSTRRILTMQLIEGMRYDEAKTADRGLRDAWGEVIYRFVWDSLWRLGLTNADAHPGNYLFHPDGSVTFLDFGCVKRMTPRRAQGVDALIRHIAARDARALHSCVLELGMIHPDHAPEPTEVLEAMTDSYRYTTAPQPFTFTPDYVPAITHSMYRENRAVARKSSLPAELVMISRNGVGMFAVLSGLRATADWNAIRDEVCRNAAPHTTYGRLDADYWAAKL